MTAPEFRPWPKTPRLNRNVVITEKIDGTNAQIYIDDAGEMHVGSRNRWITPDDDNYGFARWASERRDQLLTLGPGHHYGEWWGAGIQRRYGLTEKRFSLFNTGRWAAGGLPECCHLVPVLAQGDLIDVNPRAVLADLARTGSVAAPGFMNPEGIILFHAASGMCYKMTLDANDKHKEQP